MSNRTKPQYLKRVKFSLALPAWQRHLLATIDPKSNSNALARLINHAIKAGALHDLAPHLPPGLTDPGELAEYLTRYHAPRTVAAPAVVDQPTPLYSSADAATLDAFANWGDDPAPPSEQPAPILPTLADILASTPDV